MVQFIKGCSIIYILKVKKTIKQTKNFLSRQELWGIIPELSCKPRFQQLRLNIKQVSVVDKSVLFFLISLKGKKVQQRLITSLNMKNVTNKRRREFCFFE
jgi:hypothetical protein